MSRYLKDFHTRFLVNGCVHRNIQLTAKYISSCQPFILHGESKVDLSLDYKHKAINKMSEFLNTVRPSITGSYSDSGFSSLSEYDSPFEVFSIEFSEGRALVDFFPYLLEPLKHLCSHMPKVNLVIDKIAGRYSYYDYISNIKFIVFKEITPRKWAAACQTEVMPEWFNILPLDGMITDMLLDELLPIINKNKYGTEPMAYTLKGRAAQARTMIRKTIKHSIIHMYPNGNLSKVKTKNGTPINLTVRFMVRGHWRVLEEGKLGKNRAGEYNVPGMTWVREHERGDKDAPLVKQVRVVHQEKEPVTV